MPTGVERLLTIAIIFAVATSALYFFDRLKLRKTISKRNYWIKQVAYGLIFGALAVCGTEFGVPISGAVMNIRDAAPLSAALFFGPYAGIIAGLIGGIERWFAVYWGAGAYTRLACTLGTIFAGLFGAFVKKYILENRKPGFIYGGMVGVVTEVVHMLLVYYTNGDDPVQAHAVTTLCSPVMIPLVGLAVALPGFIITLVFKENLHPRNEEKRITQHIEAGLFIAVILAFITTNVMQYFIQDTIAIKAARDSINTTLEDVRGDIKASGIDANDNEAFEEFIAVDIYSWHIGATGYLVVLNKDGYAVAYTKDALLEEERDCSDVIDSLLEQGVGECRKRTYEDISYYSGFFTHGDYIIVAMYPCNEADFSKDLTTLLTALLEVVILAVVFMMIYILIRLVIVKNLDKVNEDLAKISSGNLDTVVKVRTSSEFASLSDDINETVDTLKDYIDMAAAKVEEELAVAKNIQRSALPTMYPEDNRYELYANMLAAKEVGGDFYDFYELDDDRVVFLIADVSGKGIPAAMFMMTAKSVIKGFVQQGASPGVAFTKANERLCQDNAAEMFVTAWMGIMDVNTGHVVYTNAGHNPPVIKQKDGTIEFLKCRPGFVLAGMDGIQYKDFELDLDEGQSLTLYTDGVTEATDAHNQLFGDDRLLEAVRSSGNLNMRYTCKLIKQKVDEFVGEAPQFDDITMLGIKRKTDEDRLGYIALDATPESADEVRDFFDAFCEHYDVPFKASTKIMVMVDEIYSNIINYSGATHSVITAEYGDGKVIMSYQDNGIAYDPLAKEDPDITLSAEERKIGGLGIFMVKKMAEDVKYTRVNGTNILDVVLEI